MNWAKSMQVFHDWIKQQWGIGVEKKFFPKNMLG